MTSEEAWHGTNINVSFFRVFGSHIWAFISKNKKKALDRKGQPLIFVGYFEDIKDYYIVYFTTHDVFFIHMLSFMRELFLMILLLFYA